MATTVFVWNNNVATAKLFGAGHTTIGHASMHITSRWTAAVDADLLEDRTREYVSWWPKKSGAVALGTARKNLFSDIEGEGGYVPDHVIRILGLDEDAMITEWASIRGKEGAHYRINVKNCSTVVARVLRAGKSLINPYYAHSPLWTPLKAKRLAFSMGGNEFPWVGLMGEMLAAGGVTASAHTRYSSATKRSTRHGNPETAARFKKDKAHGLAHFYK